MEIFFLFIKPSMDLFLYLISIFSRQLLGQFFYFLILLQESSFFLILIDSSNLLQYQ
jgi:hypothetical protein